MGWSRAVSVAAALLAAVAAGCAGPAGPGSGPGADSLPSAVEPGADSLPPAAEPGAGTAAPGDAAAGANAAGPVQKVGPFAGLSRIGPVFASPDGGRVAVLVEAPDARQEVWEVAADGARHLLLEIPAPAEFRDDLWLYPVRWEDQGLLLLAAGRQRAGPGAGRPGIWILRAGRDGAVATVAWREGPEWYLRGKGPWFGPEGELYAWPAWGGEPVYRFDLATGESAPATEGLPAWERYQVSPDGRWLYWVKGDAPWRIHLRDLRSGEARTLPAPGGAEIVEEQGWSNGHMLLGLGRRQEWVTDELFWLAAFTELVTVDTSGAEVARLRPPEGERIGLGPAAPQRGPHPDATGRIIFTTGEMPERSDPAYPALKASALWQWDPATGETRRLADLPGARIEAIRQTGRDILEVRYLVEDVEQRMRADVAAGQARTLPRSQWQGAVWVAAEGAAEYWLYPSEGRLERRTAAGTVAMLETGGRLRAAGAGAGWLFLRDDPAEPGEAYVYLVPLE